MTAWLDQDARCLVVVVLLGCATAGPIAIGQQLERERKYAEAVDHYEKALAANADRYEAFMGLARSHVELKQHSPAKQAVDEALDLKDTEEARVVLVDALVGLRSYEDAAETLRELTRRDPKSTEYHLRLGQILVKDDQLEASVDALERALALDPTLLPARLLLGETLAALQQYDAAIEVVDAGVVALRRAGLSALPLKTLLGYLYEHMNRPDDALRTYQGIIEKDAGNVKATAGLGRAMRKVGQVEGSIELLQSASRRYPKNAALLVELGVSYRDFAMEEQAMATLQEAMNSEPTYADVYDPLLDLMEKNKASSDQVLMVVRAAATALPERFDIQLRLGKRLLKRKAYDEAVPPLSRAVGIEPSSVEANYALGVAQAHLGRIDAAMTTYDALAILDQKKALQLSEVIAKQQALSGQEVEGETTSGAKRPKKDAKHKGSRKKKRSKQKRRSR